MRAIQQFSRSLWAVSAGLVLGIGLLVWRGGTAPANQPLASPVPAVVQQDTVASGTEVVITAIADYRRPGADQDERYYQVRLPDGRSGWLPERALRLDGLLNDRADPRTAQRAGGQ